MNQIIDNLNDAQKQAVMYNEGPSLIIAGAGSGKTRVLTSKVAWLLKEQGLNPWNIMALTFTNKAAREMKERVATMVDASSASRLWMGTFHSIFLRILRMESAAIGFPADFSVYDTTDTKNLLKNIVKEMQLDDKVYKPNSLYSHISNAKNSLISPQEYLENADIQQRDQQARMPRLAQVYAQYTGRCRKANAMDFDDILYYTHTLFSKHPDILAQWQERFKFILVDEYQDTNFAQYLIVKMLAEKHHRVCVVGDDSQSIYSFRGANIDNILHFQGSYPECRLFKLERNYRSTQTIVNAANSLISKNQNRIRKQVFSQREKGSLIKIVSAFSDVEEAYMTATHILELRLREHDPWNEFAVLYRTNAQSRVLEEAMRKRNIPYRVYGGMSFYQRKEIKDIIAYLRLLVNPSDEEAFKRVLNYPARGIGDTTLQKLLQTAALQQISLWEVLQDPMKYQLPVNGGTLNKLMAFRQFIESLQTRMQQCDVYELTQALLLESGIQQETAKDVTPEGIMHKENLESLLGGMHDFVENRREEGSDTASVTDYLSEVSLLTDQDENDSEDKVTLMTVHASKGLEFNNVLVTGMEENLFPSSRINESERELEEERRLLYVAITRARNHCLLSYAKSRFRNGTTDYPRPSRFLYELDRSYLEITAQNGYSQDSGNRPTAFSGLRESRESYITERSSDTSRNGYFRKPGAPAPVRKPLEQATDPQQAGTTSYQPAATHKWRKLDSHRPTADKAPIPAEVSDRQGVASVQSSKGTFRVGRQVQHDRFGIGTVTKIEGQGDNCKIGVEFQHTGYKLLVLKFASMIPLN
ncbi:MAG: UvrD-helicase domain-containing protein [Bacteroidales bacterium]|nr:UvrD-helicase domain-containing protein [Bacteroidales bacterium]